MKVKFILQYCKLFGKIFLLDDTTVLEEGFQFRYNIQPFDRLLLNYFKKLTVGFLINLLLPRLLKNDHCERKTLGKMLFIFCSTNVVAFYL